MKTEIVAEIGINHNGCMCTAIDLIEAAQDCGANTCKFQVFSPALSYDGLEDLYETLLFTKFDIGDLEKLREHCITRNMGFLCSVFDRPSIDLLVKMGETRVKIPSSRNTIGPYLDYVAKQPFSEILLAIGACNAGDVLRTRSRFDRQRVVEIECISAYPCDPSKFVLKDYVTPHLWGLSDHSLSWEICTAAVLNGARYIEKHFTLDQYQTGPDHKASLNPKQFARMVKEIRNVEMILHNVAKVVLPEERNTVMRKLRHNLEQYE
jgi:N,N'-diacetyllegionaminate synthase